MNFVHGTIPTLYVPNTINNNIEKERKIKRCCRFISFEIKSSSY